MSIEYNLSELLQAEIEAIDEFRNEESKRQGRTMSNNEAASIWIARNAARFRQDFEANLEEKRSG